MGIISNRLKKFIKYDSNRKWNGSIREFERLIGWNNAAVNQFIDSPKIERLNELKKFVPELNLDWLLSGTGEMLNNESVPDRLPSIYSTLKDVKKSTPISARQIIEGEDYIWQETIIIPEKAGMALAQEYFPDSMLAELNKGQIRVKREYRGRYYEIEAVGDSMNDGTVRAMLPKDWFSARDIPRDMWRHKLHFNRWGAFYFLHDTRGHIIKEIVDHNTETGELILRSWNQDKEEYPDFTINIKDCYIIANIVKLINRDYNPLY